MEKEGLSPDTIKFRTYRLNRLIKLGANLLEPKTLDSIFTHFNGKQSYKKTYVNTYKAFTTCNGLDWKKPKVTVKEQEPFLPTNEEVTQLISGCGKTTATLLQLLAETGMRIGEASEIRWKDLDFERKIVSINFPEKNSNPRTLPISNKLIAMLQRLRKRKDNHVFNPRKRTLDTTFRKQRKRIVEKLQNPILKEIHFHTFRHLKAKNEYNKTQDIKHVQHILGHKRLETTNKYTHYTPFKEEEYHCKTAKTPEEAQKLIETGFEYVTEMDGLKLFRKRK
jgi:integrase